jgi:nucleoside-diphosphate-sugar epimerase
MQGHRCHPDAGGATDAARVAVRDQQDHDRAVSRAWGGIFGTSGISLRYANVYGPRQDPAGEAGVIAIFCHRLLTGQTPIINGDGEQTRDYVYVEDVAEANLRALTCTDVTGSVNIATGTETSVNEIHRARPAAAVPARPTRPCRPGEQRRNAESSARRRVSDDPTLAADRLAHRQFFKSEIGESQRLFPDNRADNPTANRRITA